MLAASAPDRVAGLVYLEAGYPYAFSNGKGPTMEEFQQHRGPQLPTPAGSSLASFSSLQKWDEEVYGVRRPEAEFRQTWDSTSDGRPAKAREFPGTQMFTAIMTTVKRYTAIRVPTLVMFASPHLPESWLNNSTDPAVRQPTRSYFTTVDALAERQAKAFEGGVHTARVVRLHGAHYIFLFKRTGRHT